MRTQQDFLREAFTKLNNLRRHMSASELRLLDDLELRATQGPTLTAHDINYLDVWQETVTKRGKEHDEFIAKHTTNNAPKAD